ncbi:MAG TPA: hypothetical protein VF661_15940 [Actinomycetales bacterium]|jgi:hypothetical protein
MRTAERLPGTADLAYWSVIGLGALSAVVRPVVDGLGLPGLLRNADALLTPVAAAAVCLLALARRHELSPATTRVLLAFAALVATTLMSWSVVGPRSVLSLGLAFSSLLLLPCALVLVVLASARGRRPHVVPLLRALVLLQLVVGFAQYVGYDVAQGAPFRADLVDGTTSHNFWPAFALPASAALLLLDRSRTRWLWPASVIVLAVYAEAKAALLVFLPVLAVVAVIVLVGSLRSRPRPVLTGDLLTRAALVTATVAVLGVGLWFTPSVQGTWQVLIGHTRDAIALGDGTAAPAPDVVTLRESIPVLVDAVTSSPQAFLRGLGPGNSVSHAAEVLLQRAPAGGSDAGPVAERLLSSEGGLQFQDAQSSVLGVWGDLGLLGALCYLAVLLLAAHALAGGRARWRSHGATSFLVVTIGAGILAGGLPLDWPEQGSIVLPLMLPLLALAHVQAARARSEPPAALVRVTA